MAKIEKKVTDLPQIVALDASDALLVSDVSEGESKKVLAGDLVIDGSISSAKLADNSVTSSKISDGAVGDDALDSTGVTAGSYTNTNLTVDENGRVTFASDGSSSGGVTSVTGGTGITASPTTGNVVVSLTDQPSDIPVGFIGIVPRNNIPSGWLECNGGTFNAGTYPELNTFLGGNTLPETRGEFIRGWDNGRGIDTGRAIGSFQDWQLSRHNHTITAHTDFGGQGQSVANSGNNTQPAVGTSFSGGSSNGNESRPRNMAFIYIIKAE